MSNIYFSYYENTYQHLILYVQKVLTNFYLASCTNSYSAFLCKLQYHANINIFIGITEQVFDHLLFSHFLLIIVDNLLLFTIFFFGHGSRRTWCPISLVDCHMATYNVEMDFFDTHKHVISYA